MLGAVLLAASLAGWNFNARTVSPDKAPAGWKIGGWGERRCLYGTAADGAGGQAMNVDMRGNFGGALQLFSPAWPMWQGRWYRVSFRAKGFDYPGQVSVMVRKQPYPWTAYSSPLKFHPENEWKNYSFVFKSKHDIQSDFGVMIEVGGVGRCSCSKAVKNYEKNTLSFTHYLPHFCISAATSRARRIISVNPLIRSSEVVDSPVTKESETVHMASAFLPALAAFI